MSVTAFKRTKLKLTVLSLLIVAAYVSLTVHLTLKFNIAAASLSRIGWMQGGLRYLVYYILLTAPLLIYQTLLFNSLSDKKSKLLKVLAVTGALMIAVGALFPVGENAPKAFSRLHMILSQAGSGLSIAAVTYMVALYCKTKKPNVKKAVLLYCGLLAVIAAAFTVLFTAALFEIGASLLFLLAMLCVNFGVLRGKKTDKNFCPNS